MNLVREGEYAHTKNTFQNMLLEWTLLNLMYIDSYAYGSGKYKNISFGCNVDSGERD